MSTHINPYFLGAKKMYKKKTAVATDVNDILWCIFKVQMYIINKFFLLQ